MVDIGSTEFEVAGAGTIRLSNSSIWRTGGKVGFSFGVSWGSHGAAGGVLSRDEALRLAEHIIKIVHRERNEEKGIKEDEDENTNY